MGYRNSQTIATFSPSLNKQPQLMPAHIHTQTHTEAVWWAMRFMSEAECSINTLSKTELYSLKLDTSSVKKGCICRSIEWGQQRENTRREKGSGNSWSVKWSNSFLIWFRLHFGNATKEQLETYPLTLRRQSISMLSIPALKFWLQFNRLKGRKLLPFLPKGACSCGCIFFTYRCSSIDIKLSPHFVLFLNSRLILLC